MPIARRTLMTAAAAAAAGLPFSTQRIAAQPRPAGRILIKGGHVATLDRSIGELDAADVLIDNGAIVAIGRDLPVTDADVIDARNKLVVPGLIDTHRHTWETLTRSLISEGDLAVYIKLMFGTLGLHYRPQDVYIGNLLGALGAQNSGITTMLDWSHIMNSPAHADAAIRGLADFGNARRVRLWLLGAARRRRAGGGRAPGRRHQARAEAIFRLDRPARHVCDCRANAAERHRGNHRRHPPRPRARGAHHRARDQGRRDRRPRQSADARSRHHLRARGRRRGDRRRAQSARRARRHAVDVLGDGDDVRPRLPERSALAALRAAAVAQRRQRDPHAVRPVCADARAGDLRPSTRSRPRAPRGRSPRPRSSARRARIRHHPGGSHDRARSQGRNAVGRQARRPHSRRPRRPFSHPRDRSCRDPGAPRAAGERELGAGGRQGPQARR